MTCPSAATCWPVSPAARSGAARTAPPCRLGPAHQRVGKRHLPDRRPGRRPSVLRVHRLGYRRPRRSPRSWPGWMRCGPRRGSARRVLPAAAAAHRHRGGRGQRRAAKASGSSSSPGPSWPTTRCRTSPSLARSPPGCTGTRGPGSARPGSPGSLGLRRRVRRGRRWGRWQDGIGIGPASGRYSGGSTRRCGPAGRVRHRVAAVRAGARRHQAGQPVADGTRSTSSTSTTAVQLVPLRRRHVGELLRARAARPDLVGAWLSGYRRVLTLPAEDEAEIWTFILYRRLLLVAWIGSHTRSTSHNNSSRATPPGAATWPRPTSAGSTEKPGAGPAGASPGDVAVQGALSLLKH